jgi:hypothetical protein
MQPILLLLLVKVVFKVVLLLQIGINLLIDSRNGGIQKANVAWNTVVAGGRPSPSIL